VRVQDPYHTREGREREGGMTGTGAPDHTQEKAESEKVRYGRTGARPDPYHTREGRERR
jgi:hypothetical protein